MALTAGTRLGPYEILSAAGAGGMGEVYRARDTRLDRTVAIKVLPEQFSQNPDLKQRFEREARAISSLNHPHICTLHDVGHQDGVDYLVMEYLEGESLAARLMKGPLPVEQVLKTGTEIADALEKAHRQGIVHRDLKPGNIMLTKSGAKLLDFGLAKPQGAMAAASGLTGTITQTSPVSPITQQGHIVGTFQYMSPEQVEGKEADARSDLFALGAVLYEMATGKRAFEGKSAISVASAILEKEPEPISRIQPLTPPALEHVVKSCLAKDPEDRIQTAHDVKLQLKWIAEGRTPQVGAAAVAASPRRWRERALWLGLGLAVAAVAVLAAWQRTSSLHPAIEVPALRLSVATPEDVGLERMSFLALSPDGRYLAFVGHSKEKQALWLRHLDSGAAEQLPGTQDAFAPFWSPDSRHLGFFAQGKLKRIAIDGSQLQVLADAPAPSGGSWSSQGVIVYAPIEASGIFRVPANGGAAAQVTTLGPRDEAHRWPAFLPDGKRFIFLDDASRSEDHFIKLASLDSSELKPLLGTAITEARWADPGCLIFVRDGTLYSQALDPGSLAPAGDPVVLGSHVLQSADHHYFEFSVSATGILVFQTGITDTDLVRVDRSGKRLGEIGVHGRLGLLRLSPDGRQLIFGRLNPSGRVDDLWMRDLARQVDSRITFQTGDVADAVFSPDGREFAFAASHEQLGDIYRAPVGSPMQTRALLKSKDESAPTDWSPDGHWLLYNLLTSKTRGDIWIVPVDGSAPGHPLLQTPFNEGDAVFSPDGRWIAYDSDESGQSQIYVQAFPGPGDRIQVSTSGGSLPKWRHDGKELFYITSDGAIAAVDVRAAGSNLAPGAPRELFALTLGDDYVPSPDGQTFIVHSSNATVSQRPATIVIGWTHALAKH